MLRWTPVPFKTWYLPRKRRYEIDLIFLTDHKIRILMLTTTIISDSCVDFLFIISSYRLGNFGKIERLHRMQRIVL